MILLKKIDAVLNCLYTWSGKNPDFQFIREKLSHLDIDEGEIRDCLLHIYRRKHIYCEVNGNRDSAFSDASNAHYLISFEGKLFWEVIKGYEEEATALSRRQEWEDSFLIRADKNQRRLNTLTLILGIATGLLFLIELVKFVYELSCQSHNQ